MKPVLRVETTVKEANRTPPPFPFIFFKPATCVADHDADVSIPKICQDDQADYEGELVSENFCPLITIELTTPLPSAS